MFKFKLVHEDNTPIEIVDGDVSFKLYIRPLTGADRLELVDALATGEFARLQRAVEPLIASWEGVCDENGSPRSFNVVNGQGNRVDQLGLFFKAVPFAAQIKTVLGIAAFAGVPRNLLDPVVASFERVLGTKIDIDPLSPPAVQPASAPSASS